MSKPWIDLMERMRQMKVKRRLKAAFRRKPRPAKVRIPDDNPGAWMDDDKDYRLGTQKEYDEFVKKRNYSYETPKDT